MNKYKVQIINGKAGGPVIYEINALSSKQAMDLAEDLYGGTAVYGQFIPDESRLFSNDDNDSSSKRSKRSRDDDDDDDDDDDWDDPYALYWFLLGLGFLIFLVPSFCRFYCSILFIVFAVKTLLYSKANFINYLIFIPIALILGNGLGLIISNQQILIRFLSPIFIGILYFIFRIYLVENLLNRYEEIKFQNLNNKKEKSLPLWVELLFVQIGLPDKWLIKVLKSKKKPELKEIEENKIIKGEKIKLLEDSEEKKKQLELKERKKNVKELREAKKKKKEEKKLKTEMDATQKDKDNPDVIKELEKLVSLKEKGLLTDEEFSAAKAKLLN